MPYRSLLEPGSMVKLIIFDFERNQNIKQNSRLIKFLSGVQCEQWAPLHAWLVTWHDSPCHLGRKWRLCHPCCQEPYWTGHLWCRYKGYYPTMQVLQVDSLQSKHAILHTLQNMWLCLYRHIREMAKEMNNFIFSLPISHLLSSFAKKAMIYYDIFW